MKLSMIAAVGKNNELGKNNGLIWHLKEDLKFFRDITSNSTVVMGLNTFYSLPKMLPNRKHIVFSIDDVSLPEEVTIYHNINDFLNDYKDYNEEIFVIGGGMIYKDFIDYVDKIYLTEINGSDNTATVYFPKFNKNDFYKEILSNNEENALKYKHVLYRRK